MISSIAATVLKHKHSYSETIADRQSEAGELISPDLNEKGLIAGSSLDGSRFMAGFVAQDAQTSGPRDVCGSVAARSSMNGKPAKNATIT